LIVSPLFHRSFNFSANTLRILRDAIPFDPQNLESFRSQVRITLCIAGTSLLGEMILAIDLDNESQLQTNEVDGVSTDRVFAAKFLTQQPPTTEHLPDVLSEFVGLPPLVAGKLDSFGLPLGGMSNGHEKCVVCLRELMRKAPHPQPLSPKRGEGSQGAGEGGMHP
jgi:hypothetical protein